MKISKQIQWWAGGVNETALGTLYSATSWTDLSSFTQNNTTASVNGSNQIVLNGGAVFTKTLDYNRISRLENWSVSMQFVYDATTQGGGVGMRSTSTFAKRNVYGYISGATGQVGIAAGDEGSMSIIATGGLVSVTPGDTVQITLTKIGNSVTASGKNITTSSSTSTASYTYVTSSISAPLTPNTGKFCFLSFAASIIIKSITISSTIVKQSRVCIIADSVAEGYGASSYSTTAYARKMDAPYHSTILCGGEADTFYEGVALIPELQELNARKYIITLGSNDIGNGVPSATYLANYTSIVTALGTGRCYHMIHYGTTRDFTALNNYITSTYSANHIIDPNVPGAGNYIDGVHLNDTGHLATYNAIVNSGLI